MGCPEPTARPGRLRGLRPLHVAALAGGVLALYLNAGPINDRDLFWHLAIGQETIANRSIDDLSNWWLAVPAPPWQTSQWLSEVLIAITHAAGGWSAFVVLRLVFLSALLLLVAVSLMRRRSSVRSTVITLLVFFTLAVTTQDRPQSVSFLFLALLGVACGYFLTERRRPPLLAVALGSLLWAQLHPLWVLAPVSFALLLACFVVEDRAWRTRSVQDSALCLLASLGGLLNPVGAASFVLPLRFQQATDVIAEWRPTTLTTVSTAAWGILLLLIFAAWAAGGSVPRSEVLWVAGWTAFGLLAYRNVTPSLLMLAPVAVVALDRVRIPSDDAGDRSTAERRGLAAIAACTAVGGVVAVAAEVRGTDPLEQVPARAVAAWISRQPEPVRVFNHYNTSGSLVSFSAGRARLVVDGRADMWGAEYIEDVVGVQNLDPGWEERLERFGPDAIVSDQDAALPQVLVREGRWRVEVRDGPFVLLTPTESAG